MEILDEKTDNKIAILAIIISNTDKVEKVNAILHEFSDFIIGRMGIPYKARSVNIISIALDAPLKVINSVSGKLGMLEGVTSKVLTAK